MQNEPSQKATQRSPFHSQAFPRRFQWKRSTLTFCEDELLITRSRKRLQAKSIATEIQRCSKVTIFCPPYWLPTLRKPLSTKKITLKKTIITRYTKWTSLYHKTFGVSRAKCLHISLIYNSYIFEKPWRTFQNSIGIVLHFADRLGLWKEPVIGAIW